VETRGGSAEQLRRRYQAPSALSRELLAKMVSKYQRWFSVYLKPVFFLVARIINERRLRNYPRLILLSVWIVLLVNLTLHRGWLGGVSGQVIGSDFITLYAAGWLYRADIGCLYDFEAQESVQQALILPTALPGLNPYISPPYVAGAYSIFTHLPLAVAFVAWTLLTLLFIALAAWLSVRFLAPLWLAQAGLTGRQALVILASSLPFVEGWQVGQNHSLTLLLMTGMTVSTLFGHWYLAGVLAGLLLYKPQFVLGFLILWLVWRKPQAWLGFLSVAVPWAGIVVLSHGLTPYLDYLAISDQLLQLPYAPGFPAFLMVTPYGLLSTALPQAASPIIQFLCSVWTLLAAMGLVWYAYRSRQVPLAERRAALALALLYPLVATPYALLHDLLILFLVLLLMSARRSFSDRLLYVSIAVYLGVLFLPLLTSPSRIALVALIPLCLLGILLSNATTRWSV